MKNNTTDDLCETCQNNPNLEGYPDPECKECRGTGKACTNGCHHQAPSSPAYIAQQLTTEADDSQNLDRLPETHETPEVGDKSNKED